MKTPRQKGTKAGIFCYSVFMVPWLGFIIFALATDPTGFNLESILGIIIGILIFSFIASFLGFSVAKKSLPLTIVASLCVIGIPIWWYFIPWLP